MAVLDALNWPVLKCPRLAGFEVSPEALKRMKATLPESLHPKLDIILERATNVLSVIHPHVYFPTYSNSLKEIRRFLGFVRNDKIATGLQSIVWRNTWNDNEAAEIKARLLQYNQDDCRALKLV